MPDGVDSVDHIQQRQPVQCVCQHIPAMQSSLRMHASAGQGAPADKLLLPSLEWEISKKGGLNTGDH